VAELLLELHHGELDGGHLTAVMMHATWAIWKERNMRIFEGRSVQPVQVFRFIKDEMALSARATGRVVQLNFYD
jgi:hypothetical protein